MGKKKGINVIPDIIAYFDKKYVIIWRRKFLIAHSQCTLWEKQLNKVNRNIICKETLATKTVVQIIQYSIKKIMTLQTTNRIDYLPLEQRAV